ncbi:MAG: ribosome biosis GTPase / thiamine phosphate phosphatase [Chloroflexota bacterium]|nr:ribosome biosis GTPase / thiamine phosphate phosphatase [Chloroflexota bacterium]
MDLNALGWSDFFAEPFEPHAARGLVPARVAIAFNRFFRVYTEQGELTVVSSGRLLHHAASRAELPTAGDWVAVRVRSDGGGAIQAVLPRKSQFTRKMAGRVVEQQVVAANVDTVFLVSGLDDEFNTRRIERYLIMTWESGAQPVVILNKTDLVDDAPELVREVEAIAAGVPVHAISSKLDEGMEIVRRYLRPGQTIALLGSSGVGKTTITNRLLGEDRFATAEVRVADSRGRHTTTNRQLVLLPQGGLLLDTPGMREIQLWDADGGAEQNFADIDDIVALCHFGDCRHGSEPGCAVRLAIDEGRLDPARFEGYLKIQEELDRFADQQTLHGQLEAKRRVKVITRAVEQLQRSR